MTAQTELLRSVCIGDMACIVDVELLAVSLIIAVIPPTHRELVFCSEGQELSKLIGFTEINDKTTSPVRSDHLKTLALNSELCIGLAGVVSTNRRFLEELLPSLPWEKCAPKQPPMNFADAFPVQRGIPLLDIGVAECLERIMSIVSAFDQGKDLLPFVGGQVGGAPSLHCVRYRDGEYESLDTQLAYNAAPSFVPSAEWASIDHIIKHHITHWDRLGKQSVEQRCLQAIELVADHSITCNKNITFRRLSRGFTKEGRDIIGGSAFMR